MHASELRNASRERFNRDLNSVVNDVEQMLSASAIEAGDAYDAAVGRVKGAIGSAKAQLHDTQQRVAQKTRAATQATDAYVHENAWKAVALAAMTGLLAGLLMRRH